MKSLLTAAVAVTALIAAPTALAADRTDKEDLLVPMGMSVDVGGGARSFISQEARDVTKPGGLWTARLVVGTRSYIGGEAAYFGSAQAIDAVGLQHSAFLLSNGAEGLLRLNAMTGAWQPYALAGAAWRHYSLANTDYNYSDVESTDDVVEIPVGIGVAYRFNRLIVDARAMYNNAFGTRLIPDTNISALSVAAKIGFEF